MDQASGYDRGAVDRKQGDAEPNEAAAPADATSAGAAPGDGAEPPTSSAAAAPDLEPPPQQTLLDWLGHELRNPIAAIDLAIHSLRELGDDRLEHPLSILERQSGQLGRVVLELLEMARRVAPPPTVGVPLRYLPRNEDPAALPIEQRVAAHARDVHRDRVAGGTGARDRLAAGTDAGRRRLLLVEDNEDLSDLLRELLTAWGFEVVVAGTALAALAKAAVRPPDVALIDIGLPDRDGCEVARALRNTLPRGIKLIGMSGYGQRHDGARALAAGFDEFMVKPLNTVRLRRLLGETVALSLAASREK